MAKKTFVELDRLTKAAEEKKRQLTEDINELLAKKAEAHNAAQAAAEAGDTDGYLDKHKAEERLDAEIFVKRTQLDKAGATLSRDDIMDAWEDYCKGYNIEQSREWSKYLTMRKQLFDQFMKVVLLQNNALKLRERCGQLAGESNLSAFKMSMIDGSNAFGLQYKRYQLQMPDTVFFLSCGLASEDDGSFFNDVIRVHKPF